MLYQKWPQCFKCYIESSECPEGLQARQGREVWLPLHLGQICLAGVLGVDEKVGKPRAMV